MVRAVIAGMLAHAGRLVATVLAVVFGVAFVTGTLIFGDSVRAGYAEAFGRIAAGVDVAVEPGADGTRLTAAQVQAVRSVPAVAVADARLAARLALLDRRGRPVTNFGLVGWAVSTDGEPGLRFYDVIGRDPGPGEALLDRDSADRLGYRAGDTITVVDVAGQRHGYRLAGLLDVGASPRYSGRSVVGLPAAVITALTGTSDYDEIVARAAAGVSQTDLAAAVARALPGGPRVVTGDEHRRALATDAADWTASFGTFLLLFGLVSLVVAAFVIYNTFAVLGALRVRQTALLRTLGAGRGQIFRAAVLESAIIGLAGGGAGVLAGVGIAYALVALMNTTVDAAIPIGAPVLGPATVGVGLLLGPIVTVAAALVPAVRATRTAPLAALRDAPTGATEPAGRRGRVARVVLAALALATGAGITMLGAGGSDLETGALLIVLGGIASFLGVLIGAPIFIGPLCAVLGAVPARLLGPPARLATANARRNPGRTAVTAATLMIGVGLMSVFSVVFASLSATAAQQIAQQYPVDVVATGVTYGTADPRLPAGYAQAVRDRPEFSAVAQVRAAPAAVGDEQVRIGAVDPASLGTLVTPPITDGSLADLRPGTVIVATSRARLGDTPLGATLTVAGEHAHADLRVIARASALAPGAADLDLLVVWSDLQQLAGDVGDSTVLAKTAPGVPPARALAALDALADEYPLVSVSSVADLTNDLQSVVDSILAVVAGLLTITVVISLFGIANTLALSVVERTRESATVRALGLTRGQLRATLFLEALLIAGAGAAVGLGFGLVYGAVLVDKALSSVVDPVLAVPWPWFAGIVILTTATAVLAAVLPARRAARASVVAAMADT